jgi:CubicO group peptidase (beta-lactamase class C family)
MVLSAGSLTASDTLGDFWLDFNDDFHAFQDIGSANYNLPGNALTPAELDSFVTAIMDAFHFPGVAACVVKNGQTAWTGTYGDAILEQDIEMTDTTANDVGSLSKTMTAVALMQLWENGSFGLDDDINDYLTAIEVVNPYYPDCAITFRHLLTHTAGITTASLSDPYNICGADQTPVTLSDFIETVFPSGGGPPCYTCFHNWVPGSVAAYSNVAAALAAYLVGVIADSISYNQYTHDSIFMPLAMDETAWYYPDLDSNNCAMGYHFDGSYNPVGYCTKPSIGSGGLKTSLADLSRFLVAFMQGGMIDEIRILENATIDSITTIQYPAIAPDQGLIWYKHTRQGKEFWGHYGGWEGHMAIMICNSDEQLGLMTFINGTSGYPISWVDTLGLALIVNEIVIFSEDSDVDSIIAGYDNCCQDYNPDQADTDDDGVGDVCDNCPNVSNPGQEDVDPANGVGDACEYTCGDANDDEAVNMLDILYLINYLYKAGPAPDPTEAADVNGDVAINMLDILYLVSYLYKSGAEPVCL